MRARSTRIAWALLAVFAAGYLAAPLSYANGNVQQQPGFYMTNPGSLPGAAVAA